MITWRTLLVSQPSTPKLHAGLHIGVGMNVNQRKHKGMQKRHRQKLSKEKGRRLPREQGRLSR